MKKILISLAFSLIAILVMAKPASASEGIYELRNLSGEEARCYGLSVLMQNQNFQVLLSCRDIHYPGGTAVFNYIVWATPIDGGKPVRLGDLDRGKVEFKTKTAFNNLFVTKETDSRPKQPKGELIMQGGRQTISILDGTGSTGVPDNDNELLEASPSPAESPAANTGGNTIKFIAAGGILFFVVLFVIVLVVFVVARR